MGAAGPIVAFFFSHGRLRRPCEKKKEFPENKKLYEVCVSDQNTISRADVIAQVEARLAGSLSQKALAGWAFDRFYAEELGSAAYEADAEDVLADVFDALMFSDDPGFGLDEAELRALIGQLQ